MSIRDLRTFVAIVEEGSFAAAARKVGRTQSAVTTQMQSLEQELGQSLFDRSKRPPALTEDAHILHGRAKGLLDHYDHVFLAGSQAVVEGDLKLGVVPSVITGMLPSALQAIRSKYPAMRIEITMGLSKDLVDRVHAGVVDAAIISDLMEGGEGLDWAPLVREPLVLIAASDAPHRKAEELIKENPFIRYTRRAWVGELIDRFLKQRKLEVRETMTLDTLEAINTMVAHRLGVSIVPLRRSGEPPDDRIRTAFFSGRKVTRTVGLISSASGSKKQLIERLLVELKNASG